MNSAEVLRICSNRDCWRVEWMHNAAEPVKYTQTMLKLISSLVDQQRTEHGPGGMWARPDDRSCSVVGGPAAELLTYDLNMLDSLQSCVSLSGPTGSGVLFRRLFVTFLMSFRLQRALTAKDNKSKQTN